MRQIILTLSLVLACTAAVNASETKPDQMINDAVKALRANDMAQLITSVQGSLDEARSSWDEARALPADPQDDAQLNMSLSMLNNPEMVEMLVQQARANAAEVNTSEISQALGMAPMMMMGFASNPEIAQAAELQFAMSLLPDLQAWVATAPFNDADLAEKAVRAFAAGVQKLELNSAADIRALEFDQFLAKAGSFSATLKETVAIYDVDLDGFLDSIKASSSDTGISLSMKMLGKDRTLDMAMVEKDGNWVPKLAVDIENMNAEADMMEGGMPEETIIEESEAE